MTRLEDAQAKIDDELAALSDLAAQRKYLNDRARWLREQIDGGALLQLFRDGYLHGMTEKRLPDLAAAKRWALDREAIKLDAQCR